jgi:hypothetical protein
MHPKISRRVILWTASALTLARPAGAQDLTDANAWAEAMGAIWSEILGAPMAALKTSTFSSYRVLSDEQELAEARARAAAKRADMEAEIARRCVLVDAAPPAPQSGEPWEQTIIDQAHGDQKHALERLASVAVFLESNSNDFSSGAVPFPAAMRMANWSLFGEVDWIMASWTKLARLGQKPDSFTDLWHRAMTLDWLASSIIRGACVRIVHGDPPTQIAAAQTDLAGVASEMRRISALFATADQRALDVVGETRRLRLRRALPQLSVLAENQARTLDEIARTWPTLSPADLTAEDTAFDEAPAFIRAAAPLLRDVGIPV